MSTIFEEFIRNFYKRHLCGYMVERKYIKWQLEPVNEGARAALPRMETDITLQSEHKKIIIDAKYYQNTLTDREKIHSGNLYQLFSYLINQQDSNEPSTMTCEGMLLYPTIDIDYAHEYLYDKHKIAIRTLNLNQDWNKIESDLLALVL